METWKADFVSFAIEANWFDQLWSEAKSLLNAELFISHLEKNDWLACEEGLAQAAKELNLRNIVKQGAPKLNKNFATVHGITALDRLGMIDISHLQQSQRQSLRRSALGVPCNTDFIPQSEQSSCAAANTSSGNPVGTICDTAVNEVSTTPRYALRQNSKDKSQDGTHGASKHGRTQPLVELIDERNSDTRRVPKRRRVEDTITSLDHKVEDYLAACSAEYQQSYADACTSAQALRDETCAFMESSICSTHSDRNGAIANRDELYGFASSLLSGPDAPSLATEWQPSTPFDSWSLDTETIRNSADVWRLDVDQACDLANQNRIRIDKPLVLRATKDTLNKHELEWFLDYLRALPAGTQISVQGGGEDSDARPHRCDIKDVVRAMEVDPAQRSPGKFIPVNCLDIMPPPHQFSKPSFPEVAHKAAKGQIDGRGREYALQLSFADRLQELDRTERDPCQISSRLLLFDVKSKMSDVAGSQAYLTKGNQRQIVAFYLGFRAADPGFVELIPNFFQGCDQDLEEYHAVNLSRESKLPPSAYRIDMCSSPYRMPTRMLLEPIRRVRACVQENLDYINPWTLVAFTSWRPLTVDMIQSLGQRSRYAMSWILPDEDTEHFSAYRAVADIQHTIMTSDNQVELKLDFVGLQPKLADFKLIYAAPGSGMLRQVFVQHKLDVKDRALRTKLTKVAIARKRKNKVNYYFTAFERFDFLMYEFVNISPGPNKARITELFFLPEFVLPDTFYTTLELEADFELPAFSRYRMPKDENGKWLERIIEIMLGSPPRKDSRPVRDENMKVEDTPRDLFEELNIQDRLPGHGRTLYREITMHGIREFFDNIMLQCATRKSGVIIAFSHEHPVCDFGFCRYSWTEEEKAAWETTGTPPVILSDLSGATPTLPLLYYVRSLETTFQGPEVLSTSFRRLNSNGIGRLLVWDLFGNDDLKRNGPLLVVPSKHFEPTENQRTNFSENLKLHKRKQHAIRTPVLSAVLNSGLTASQYAVSPAGPSVYYESQWDALWLMFDDFLGSSTDIVEHPCGHLHKKKEYLCSLSELHERLVEEDRRQHVGNVSKKRKHPNDDEFLEPS
ncbi:hypothetical protein KCU67_g434, partial [Aureobasidium melanogenum]